MTTPKFQKDQFDQHVANGNYEVFTPEEVAVYYKDGIIKSLNGELQGDEKKEFVADCMSLNKAVLVDGDKETTVYFRKSVVSWEVAEDGTIMKGIAGVYADVPVNRLLGRVGEAYIPDEGFMKSLDDMEDSAIAKAMRTGRYADTAENRRLHRVGQPYNKRAGKGEPEEDGGGKKPAEKGEPSEKMKNILKEYASALKGAHYTSGSEKIDGKDVETLHVSGELDGHKVSFKLYGGNNAHFLESVDGDSDIDSDFEDFESLSELKKQVGYVVEGHEDDDD